MYREICNPENAQVNDFFGSYLYIYIKLYNTSSFGAAKQKVVDLQFTNMVAIWEALVKQCHGAIEIDGFFVHL
jgi:hypothetical protein